MQRNRLQHDKREMAGYKNQQLVILKCVYFLCYCMILAIDGPGTELQHKH